MELRCVCKKPETPGVIHRTEAPCFVIQDDTALLRQALEALEFAWRAMPGRWEIGNAAITALRERLK